MRQIIEIRNSMNDVENVTSCLLRNGYTVTCKTIYKKFPEERDIDFFRIEYWKDDME